MSYKVKIRQIGETSSVYRVCSAAGIHDYTYSLPKKDAEYIMKKTNQIIEILPHVGARDIVELVIRDMAVDKNY